jgi:hypothetical protein
MPCRRCYGPATQGRSPLSCEAFGHDGRWAMSLAEGIVGVNGRLAKKARLPAGGTRRSPPPGRLTSLRRPLAALRSGRRRRPGDRSQPRSSNMIPSPAFIPLFVFMVDSFLGPARGGLLCPGPRPGSLIRTIARSFPNWAIPGDAGETGRRPWSRGSTGFLRFCRRRAKGRRIAQLGKSGG